MLRSKTCDWQNRDVQTKRISSSKGKGSLIERKTKRNTPSINGAVYFGLSREEVIELCHVLNLLAPLIRATPGDFRPRVTFGATFIKLVESNVPEGKKLWTAYGIKGIMRLERG